MKKYSNAENWGIYYTPQTKEEKETAKAPELQKFMKKMYPV